MGLELAEIFMDIEDEFSIRLPDACLGNGKTSVSDLEDAVVGQDVLGAIRKLLDNLPNADDNGDFSEPQYSEFWNQHKGLPSPNRFFGIKKVKVKKQTVVDILADRLNRYENSMAIRQKVRDLIRDRLSWPSEISSDMDLIKDLHCD